MIVAAAVIIDGKVLALPAPARHHHILHKYPMPEHHHGEQGFIDDNNGFVSRAVAGGIALREGQIKVLTAPPNLFSEDLW